jgi:hypothetical protein
MLYRNVQLGKFLHRCTKCCWKYNRFKNDKTCRFSFPKELGEIASPESVTITDCRVGKRGKIRTRVEPKRNNIHLNACVRSPLFHLAHAGNYDVQFISDTRGAAEYSASYSLKPEQPDSKLMHQILDRLLSKSVTSECTQETLRNKLKCVGIAMLSSATITATQACYFLLGLPYVEASRNFISINTLPYSCLTMSLITNIDELRTMSPDATIIREPGLNSQIGYRRAYAALAAQQVRLKQTQMPGSFRYRRPYCDVTFYAMMVN